MSGSYRARKLRLVPHLRFVTSAPVDPAELDRSSRYAAAAGFLLWKPTRNAGSTRSTSASIPCAWLAPRWMSKSKNPSRCRRGLAALPQLDDADPNDLHEVLVRTLERMFEWYAITLATPDRNVLVVHVVES